MGRNVMRINLMPKKERKDTLERLVAASRAGHKLMVFHLKRENEAQHKLLEAYKRYVKFLEGRHRIGVPIRFVK